MPYISKDERRRLIDLTHYADFTPNIWEMHSPGELSYMLTSLLKIYLDQHEFNYQSINDILGALKSVELEFYSRVVRPYEEIKIQENGDVYDIKKAFSARDVNAGDHFLANSEDLGS